MSGMVPAGSWSASVHGRLRASGSHSRPSKSAIQAVSSLAWRGLRLAGATAVAFALIPAALLLSGPKPRPASIPAERRRAGGDFRLPPVDVPLRVRQHTLMQAALGAGCGPPCDPSRRSLCRSLGTRATDGREALLTEASAKRVQSIDTALPGACLARPLRPVLCRSRRYDALGRGTGPLGTGGRRR